jgi:hypothetical protein
MNDPLFYFIVAFTIGAFMYFIWDGRLYYLLIAVLSFLILTVAMEKRINSHLYIIQSLNSDGTIINQYKTKTFNYIYLGSRHDNIYVGGIRFTPLNTNNEISFNGNWRTIQVK